MLLKKNVSAIVITGLIALRGIRTLPAFPADSLFVDAMKMPAVATVGKRFQSFNIEMPEVTGGRFWKPYKSIKPGATVADPGADLSNIGR